MKKLLASASLLALSSVTVLAADFPMKAPMAAPAPVFSWTGCYVGGHVGAGTSQDLFSGDNSFFTSGDDVDLFRGANTNSGTGKGGLAGGQLGCNYQDGNAVFGLEGEGYWSGIKSTTGFNINLTPGSEGFSSTATNKNDFSVAARVGMAFDRTLVYGKAGWVWGNFAFNSATSFPTCPTCVLETFHSSGTLDGLLLGVGVEHAFTPNWTVKLEYNFLDFGSKGLNFTLCEAAASVACTSTNTTTGSNSQHVSMQVFKVGFNYLFNWGATPVLAKY